ncbi:hypothetical protein JMJ77_0009333 [Colletotrichum scovillei]|uniref:Uncharacterized protein n=1 Tax=Colletotrichum scovillei TaxID=1209932 RepID=A0A9P7QY03_9PEZI|nr:hypothetical protein JMJ77_0009333 [Colletotrichum scovillei]KAG7052411.1 hypothetical protein JMJ78_0005429 [Colletotrichum scovillei]KAG7064703.1 hypothetical protein JMJ76_0012463 [Colletotrichum scovillei]
MPKTLDIVPSRRLLRLIKHNHGTVLRMFPRVNDHIRLCPQIQRRSSLQQKIHAVRHVVPNSRPCRRQDFKLIQLVVGNLRPWFAVLVPVEVKHRLLLATA